jgi:hypothetical protein
MSGNAVRWMAGVNPVTGVQYSASLIGAPAPGVGDAADGVVFASRAQTRIANRGRKFALRVGLAWGHADRGAAATVRVYTHTEANICVSIRLPSR